MRRKSKQNETTYLTYTNRRLRVVAKRNQKACRSTTPADDKDEELTPYLRARIEEGLQQIKEGKVTRYTLEELTKRMGL